MPKYTVTIEVGEHALNQDIFATYLRDGEPIAISGLHIALLDEIREWVTAGRMPRNGTFYKFSPKENLMQGNKFSAVQDRQGNWTIRRFSDGATVYLQGDDATEFTDNHRILDAITYPSGPFKTYAEHVDACLDMFETVMPERKG